MPKTIDECIPILEQLKQAQKVTVQPNKQNPKYTDIVAIEYE
jgi:hypothetical protein